MPARDAFEVSGWLVCPAANEIRSVQDRTVARRIEPKAMQVFLRLADTPGKVLSRELLLETVWPDVFVTEGTLNRCVSQLRKSFGDDPRAPSIIETIPKRGYRLISPVGNVAGDSGHPSARASEAGALGPDARRKLNRPNGTIVEASQGTPSQFSADSRRRFRVAGPSLSAAALLVVLGASVAGSVVSHGPTGTGPDPAPATRPLTAGVGTEHSAALIGSDRVLYVARVPATGRSGIYLRGIGTDKPLLLTDPSTDASYPAPAPDGQQFAFFSCDGAAPCVLNRSSTVGRDVRPVLEGVLRPWGLSWSSDGATLVFSARDSTTGSWRLSTVQPDSGIPHVITNPPDTYRGDVDPAFGPDSKTIAFKRSVSEGVADLFVVVDGGHPVRLTSDAVGLAGHTWDPDGQKLYVSSNRAGLFQLWRVGIDGSLPERIRDVAARDPGSPRLSSDGSVLVFEEWTIDVNLWGGSVESGSYEKTIASTWWNRQPAISPDGHSVVFVSARSGAPELWRANLDGSDPTRVSSFEGATAAAPRWSPDGRRIAFELFVGGQADIYITGADGSKPRRLTRDAADDRYPVWSGDAVYFGSNRTGSWQIWKVPDGGGAAIQVTQNGGKRALLSPDAGTVYFTRHDEDGLWEVPATGGFERLVTSQLGREDWGNWSVTDVGIFFVVRRDGRPELARLDYSSELSTAVASLDGSLVPDEPGLAISPDGRTVLYARVERVESDLAYVSPFLVAR